MHRGMSTRQVPYRPLRHVIFGGEHGGLLHSLKSIKGFRAQECWGPTGLEFSYDDGSSILWGSRGVCESELSLHGCHGEYVTEIKCHYRAWGLWPLFLEVSTGRTISRCSPDCQRQINTNHEHSMSIGTLEKKYDSVVSTLVAAGGERIVGFYAGPGDWFSRRVSMITYPYYWY